MWLEMNAKGTCPNGKSIYRVENLSVAAAIENLNDIMDKNAFDGDSEANEYEENMLKAIGSLPQDQIEGRICAWMRGMHPSQFLPKGYAGIISGRPNSLHYKLHKSDDSMHFNQVPATTDISHLKTDSSEPPMPSSTQVAATTSEKKDVASTAGSTGIYAVWGKVAHPYLLNLHK